MIISDKNRFAFIHIPKCAGTSVRTYLSHFNDWQVTGPPWIETTGPSYIKKHATLGLLYYGHMPLFVLAEYFPNEFAKIKEYWSFSVVRNPFDRFVSSVSQRLREYSDQPIEKRTVVKTRSVVHETIEYLSQLRPARGLLPLEYIHFQRQIDYIQFEGDRIIDSIYTIDQIDKLFRDVERKTGQKLAEHSGQFENTPANQTIVFRNEIIRRLIDTSRPITNHLVKVLPESAKQRMRNRIYVPIKNSTNKALSDIFEERHVQAFIRDYYADDIALYQRVLEAANREVI